MLRVSSSAPPFISPEANIGQRTQRESAAQAPVLTVKCFESLAGGSDPDWAEAAWALIQDPQDWTAKEELLLQVVTDKSACYGPPRTLTELSPFLHLRPVDTEGGTRLVKLYTAMGEVLKRGGPSLGGGPEVAQGTSLQKLREAGCYFVGARDEINEKLEAAISQGSSRYQLIPTEIEGEVVAQPLSFLGAGDRTFGQLLGCLSRINFCPPSQSQSQPQAGIGPAPTLNVPPAGPALISSLTVENLRGLVNCRNPNWENAARALIEDPHDWRAKEKLLLQVVTDASGCYGRPETLAKLRPFYHLKSVDADGGTRLVKLYTAIGNALKQSRTHNSGNRKLQFAWNYFARAREKINQTLRRATSSGLFSYRLIPDYTEDAFYGKDFSCSHVNAQAFEQRADHRSEPQSLPPLQGGAYSVPACSFFVAGRLEYPAVGLIGRTWWLKNLVHMEGALGVNQVNFLRARIAANGVEVQRHGGIEQWLVLEINFRHSRGDVPAAGSPSSLPAASGFAPRFVPPVESGAGAASRVIDILFGSELKPIPVCRLENGILITPAGKRYKYPLPSKLVTYAARCGYKARTPEGEENMYLIFAEPKETLKAEEIDLDAADIPLFRGFVSRIKEALGSDELLYRKAICSYENALTTIRHLAGHLWEHGLNGLQWICTQPKDTNWTEALNSAGLHAANYAWVAKWFCQNEAFAQNLIPAESHENYRQTRGGKLIRSLLTSETWALNNLQHAMANLGTFHADFLRARVAADGVEVQTHRNIQQWLVFEITPHSPRGDDLAAGFQSALPTAGCFTPKFVPLPEDGAGRVARVIDIPFGSELKPIPVCRLENEILITPSGKKYKYPLADEIANYVATYGYKARTPEGKENMYLVCAQRKEKFEIKPGDLNPADAPLFMDFVRKIKETLESNDLIYRKPIKTYKCAAIAIRRLAHDLRSKAREGLPWIRAQSTDTNWPETLSLLGLSVKDYGWAVPLFCQEAAEKLIPAESDETYRLDEDKLKRSPGPSGRSSKRPNEDRDSPLPPKQSR